MKLIGGLDNLLHRQALSRWDRIAKDLPACSPTALHAIRQEAADLRTRLDRIIDEADDRLGSGATKKNKPRAPAESDWVWRPSQFRTRLAVRGFAGVANGAALGDELKVFHDCATSEITIRQHPCRGQGDTAPHGLDLDILGFDGSFLSLVFDLPREATEGLSLSHIVQVDLEAQPERPLELFVRLNVKHGPNVESVVREFDLKEGHVSAEIDLAYTDIVEPQIERAWVDIIVGRPAMNCIAIRDLVVSRRLRAEM